MSKLSPIELLWTAKKNSHLISETFLELKFLKYFANLLFFLSEHTSILGFSRHWPGDQPTYMWFDRWILVLYKGGCLHLPLAGLLLNCGKKTATWTPAYGSKVTKSLKWFNSCAKMIAYKCKWKLQPGPLLMALRYLNLSI